MKKQFALPEAEIVKFSVQDIVTTSGSDNPYIDEDTGDIVLPDD